MKMVSRFTWTKWSKGTVLQHEENRWQGEHDGYQPVTHKRTVMALKGDRWLVVDHLHDEQLHHYALHWLLNDYPFEQQGKSLLLSIDSLRYKVLVGLLEGKSTFSVIRGDEKSTRGWRSQYYGEKEPAVSVMLETDQPRVCFWTFLGFESDKVSLVGNKLEIGFDGAQTAIDLQHLP
jgi:heparinase II/III-like protein